MANTKSPLWIYSLSLQNKMANTCRDDNISIYPEISAKIFYQVPLDDAKLKECMIYDKVSNPDHHFSSPVQIYFSQPSMYK